MGRFRSCVIVRGGNSLRFIWNEKRSFTSRIPFRMTGLVFLANRKNRADEQGERMAERPVLVGLIPQAVVLERGDSVSWISDAGNLKVEFDVNRCPFGSNVFQ